MNNIGIFAVLTDDGCNHSAEQAVNLLNFRLGFFYAYYLSVVLNTSDSLKYWRLPIRKMNQSSRSGDHIL